MVSEFEVETLLREQQPPGTWFVPADCVAWPRASTAMLGLVAKGRVERRAVGQNDPRRSRGAQYEYRLP